MALIGSVCILKNKLIPVADTIRCTEEVKSHYDQLIYAMRCLISNKESATYKKAMVVVAEANRLIDVAKAKEATD
jgi:aspartate 1-decarboxylase